VKNSKDSLNKVDNKMEDKEKSIIEKHASATEVKRKNGDSSSATLEPTKMHCSKDDLKEKDKKGKSKDKASINIEKCASGAKGKSEDSSSASTKQDARPDFASPSSDALSLFCQMTRKSPLNTKPCSSDAKSLRQFLKKALSVPVISGSDGVGSTPTRKEKSVKKIGDKLAIAKPASMSNLNDTMVSPTSETNSKKKSGSHKKPRASRSLMAGLDYTSLSLGSEEPYVSLKTKKDNIVKPASMSNLDLLSVASPTKTKKKKSIMKPVSTRSVLVTSLHGTLV
jgi:hypothetical protein